MSDLGGVSLKFCLIFIIFLPNFCRFYLTYFGFGRRSIVLLYSISNMLVNWPKWRVDLGCGYPNFGYHKFLSFPFSHILPGILNGHSIDVNVWVEFKSHSCCSQQMDSEPITYWTFTGGAVRLNFNQLGWNFQDIIFLRKGTFSRNATSMPPILNAAEVKIGSDGTGKLTRRQRRWPKTKKNWRQRCDSLLWEKISIFLVKISIYIYRYKKKSIFAIMLTNYSVLSCIRGFKSLDSCVADVITIFFLQALPSVGQ